MPSTDGSVRLEVDLTTGKADKQLSKLYGKIKKFEQQVETETANKNSLAEQYAKAGAELDKATAKVRQLKKELRETNGTDAKNDLRDQIAEATENQRIWTKEVNRLNSAYDKTTAKIKNATEEINSAKGEYGAIEEAVASTRQTSGLRETVQSAMSSLSGFITESPIRKAVSSVLTTAKGILSKSIKTAFSGIKKLLNSFGKTNNSVFSNGLKYVLRYGIGIRSLFTLFTRLRSYVTSAVTSFASADKETASSINSLKSSLATLKNSWGAAFAPVLNIVTPILNKLISMCTKAANTVAALLSALTGKSTYKVATSGAEAVADSVSDVADASEDAAEEAEEAKKQLMSFDELNILKNEDTSSNGTGGTSAGGTGTGTSDAYTETELPEWAKQVADLWNNGEYYKLGEFLADQLWDAIDNIDFEALGDKFGKGLDAILTTATGFVQNFPWTELGGKFGTFVNNAIDDVNWSNLGYLMQTKIITLTQIAAGFLNKTNWYNVTDAIFQFFDGAIFDVDWVGLAEGLVDGLIKAFGEINDRLSEADAVACGNKIGEMLITFTKKVDIPKLASSFSTLLITALQKGTDALKGLNESGASDAIGDTLVKTADALNIEGIAESLTQFLIEAIKLIPFEDVASVLWNSLLSALSGIIKGATGIDVSKYMGYLEEQCYVEGQEDASALEKGLVDGMEFSTAVLLGAVDKAFDAMEGTGKETGESIGKNITTGITESIDVTQAATKLKLAMVEYETAMEEAATANRELKEAEEALTSYTESHPNERDEEYNALATALDLARTKADSANESLTLSEGNVESMTTALNDLLTQSGNLEGEMEEDGKNAMTGEGNGITEGTQAATDAMTAAQEAILKAEQTFNEINSPSKTYETEGKYLMEGMANGIEAGAPTVQTALTTVMQAMLNQLKVSLETARAYVQSTIRNLQSIVNNAKFRLEVHGSYPIFSVSTRTVAGQTIPSIFRRMVYYAKGGIVDSATLFGNNVIGEAGKEAIVPLERHTEWISMVAEDLSDMIGTDGISDKLSTLATYMGKVPDAISKLTEAFTTTPKPAMANGSVVPPSALASASVANLSQDEVYSLLADVKGVVMSAANLVTKAINDKSTDIEIDGTTLARKMYSYNKAVSKEHGASLVVT